MPAYSPNSAINNPNVGPEATAKAEEKLEGMQASFEKKDKDPKHIAAGLKGCVLFPNIRHVLLLLSINSNNGLLTPQ